MNHISRDEMLKRLAEATEAASERKLERDDGVLLKIMRALGVKLGHFVEMREVLGEGKWATKDDPYAYVAQATRNTARRLERQDTGFVASLDDVQLAAYEGQADKAANRLNGSRGPNYRELVRTLPPKFRTVNEPSAYLKSIAEETNSLSPPDVDFYHVGAAETPDFQAWARAAGLTYWQQEALRFMAAGFSRDKSLEKQPNDASKRALAAAYRQLNRRGFDRLRSAVPPRGPNREKRASNNYPKGAFSSEPGREQPPKSVIAGVTPARSIEICQPFDPIPWWAGPVPRKKTK